MAFKYEGTVLFLTSHKDRMNETQETVIVQ